MFSFGHIKIFRFDKVFRVFCGYPKKYPRAVARMSLTCAISDSNTHRYVHIYVFRFYFYSILYLLETLYFCILWVLKIAFFVLNGTAYNIVVLLAKITIKMRFWFWKSLHFKAWSEKCKGLTRFTFLLITAQSASAGGFPRMVWSAGGASDLQSVSSPVSWPPPALLPGSSEQGPEPWIASAAAASRRLERN